MVVGVVQCVNQVPERVVAHLGVQRLRVRHTLQHDARFALPVGRAGEHVLTDIVEPCGGAATCDRGEIEQVVNICAHLCGDARHDRRPARTNVGDVGLESVSGAVVKRRAVGPQCCPVVGVGFALAPLRHSVGQIAGESVVLTTTGR